ncbi:MAG: hypothetical protein WAL32_13195 [Terriglobales bacterium]
MAAPCIAPPVALPVEKKSLQEPDWMTPKPPVKKRPVRDLLVEIFQGHEEYLGWTPD